MEVPRLILHHYTSGAGLLGILESKQVWASNMHSLNDSKELAHAIELGKAAIYKVLNTTGRNEDCDYYNAITQALDSIARVNLYVSCFSAVDDSLSQWRGYCPPGFGYSIGFDGYELEKIAKEQGFILKKCIYDDFDQRRIIGDWASRRVNEMLVGLRLAQNSDEFVRNTSGAMIDEFMEFAPFLKDRAFKDEEEWRLVSLVNSNDPRLMLRAGKSLLISYLPINLLLGPSSPLIWNIRVGPTPHPELASTALTHYFNKLKIRNGVGPSRVPYRDW